MNPTAIICVARDLGIHLSVSTDDNIEYRPKSRMTRELLAEIKANNQALLFDLLTAEGVIRNLVVRKIPSLAR